MNNKTSMRISSGEIAAILEKYDVCGDEGALQDSCRKRLGQRLMASIRDETGTFSGIAHRHAPRLVPSKKADETMGHAGQFLPRWRNAAFVTE